MLIGYLIFLDCTDDQNIFNLWFTIQQDWKFSMVLKYDLHKKAIPMQVMVTHGTLMLAMQGATIDKTGKI